MKGDTHYEYRFEDRSVVLRVVEPRVLVPFVRTLPRWLTPNQITIAGQTAALLAFVVAVSIRPMSAAGFVAIAVGTSLFIFADSIDGLFARHSKQTSRLGEFLDHWLDALSVPLVVFAFALVLQVPPALALAAASVSGFLHYTTMLHGFRVGFVHLGAIGMVEGIGVGAAACIVAAVFGPEVFTRPLIADASLGMILLCGLIAGGCLAFGPMRRVFARLTDFAAVVVLLVAVAAWYAWGNIPVALAGLLTIATTAWFEGRVLRARLLRVPLALNDWLLCALIVGGAGVSLALNLSPPAQTIAAGIATTYALGRSSIVFAQMVRALRLPVVAPAVPSVTAPSPASRE